MALIDQEPSQVFHGDFGRLPLCYIYSRHAEREMIKIAIFLSGSL